MKVTKMLRGGMGNAVVARTVNVQHVPKVGCKAAEARKAELAARIEEEAERDALAIRQHRALVPARERKFVVPSAR
jgi:hypothetical protein